MSADNGVYIVKFPEGYRVVHAQAIDNIDYFPKGSKERKRVLKQYFGKSKVFENVEDAYKEATKLYDEIIGDAFGICEYGIQFIGEYESFSEVENECLPALREEWNEYLTIKQLKEIIKDLPDDTLVLYQRIEDLYFAEHGWKSYLRDDEWQPDPSYLDEYVVTFSAHIDSLDNNLYLTAHY